MLAFAEHLVRTLQVITWFRQTVSKPVAAETRVLSQATPCEIFGGTKWHWNRFLLRMLEISLPVSVYRYVTLIRCSSVTAIFTVCSQLTASLNNTLKNMRVHAHNVAQSCLRTLMLPKAVCAH
jgi:hypothetical protein